MSLVMEIRALVYLAHPGENGGLIPPRMSTVGATAERVHD